MRLSKDLCVSLLMVDVAVDMNTKNIQINYKIDNNNKIDTETNKKIDTETKTSGS